MLARRCQLIRRPVSMMQKCSGWLDAMVMSFHLFVCSYVCSLKRVLLMAAGAYRIGYSGPTDLFNPLMDAGNYSATSNKKPSYCWDSQPSVAIFRT